MGMRGKGTGGEGRIGEGIGVEGRGGEGRGLLWSPKKSVK